MNPFPKNITPYLPWIVCFVLLYFPIFHHLDYAPLYGWDEALFGMRAVYLAEELSYLERFNLTLWIPQLNLKPPLMTFVQALSLSIFPKDMPELALRLPIALCVLALAISLLQFIKRELGDTF